MRTKKKIGNKRTNTERYRMQDASQVYKASDFYSKTPVRRNTWEKNIRDISSKKGVDVVVNLKVTSNAINDINKLEKKDQISTVKFFKRLQEANAYNVLNKGQNLVGNISSQVLKINNNLRAVVTFDNNDKDNALVLGVVHSGDKKAYAKAYNSMLNEFAN